MDHCHAGSSTGIDTIKFAIGSGAHTITLSSGLVVSTPVLIDGSTPPGFAGIPLIRLDGAGTLGPSLISFDPGSQTSRLNALQLTGTQYAALSINTDSITVTGSYFETDGTNLVADSSSGSSVGIWIGSGSHNVIGGSTAAERNVISGRTGVEIDGGSFNTVLGNYMGVQSNGNHTISGQYHEGVFLSVPVSGITSNNFIRKNVIGGFGVHGIDLEPGVSSTTIQGNKIGVGKNGSSNVANSQDGIYVYGSNSNIIGGSTAAKRNVISGNLQSQIYLTSLGSLSADGNVIQGNYIGTNAGGESSVGGTTGINVFAGDNNLIGGALSGQGNLISGFTSGTGINISVFASNTKVYGNRIGTNKEGTVALANDTGILAASPVAVGDGNPSGGNLISGNTTYGVYVSAGTAGTVLVYNNIGSSLDGGLAIPNGAGVQLNFAAASGGAQITQNWFAHNTYGVYIENNAPVAASSNNNCFNANVTDAVFNGGGTPAPFAGNWWGAASGPTNGSNPSGTGDPVTNSVDFSGFLSTPPSASACNIQLLKNADFEFDTNRDNRPDSWTFAGFNIATDKRDCAVRNTGACSLKLVGDGTAKTATQTFLRNGAAGDLFSFALWSKASSVPIGGVYRMQVQFYNGAALLATKTKSLSTGTHAFQQVSSTYTAPGPYTKVVFRITFQEASGTAWFDTANLNWKP